MKGDPRATRFGIFQIGHESNYEFKDFSSLWPSGSGTVPNGTGEPSHDVEPCLIVCSGTAYYPATLAINGPADARDTATVTYADNDSVTRPADAIYPGAATTTGSSTPYYTTSTSYRPIMLNRPFRNVAELGYAFRDLPWKTLDFFSRQER